MMSIMLIIKLNMIMLATIVNAYIKEVFTLKAQKGYIVNVARPAIRAA